MLPNAQLDAALTLKNLIDDLIQGRNYAWDDYRRLWNESAKLLGGRVPTFPVEKL